MKILGDKLRKERKSKRISQVELAKGVKGQKNM